MRLKKAYFLEFYAIIHYLDFLRNAIKKDSHLRIFRLKSPLFRIPMEMKIHILYN